MIQSVFIIHESGLCLLSRTYGDSSKNIDLFSGLLVAISSFAKSFIGDKIHEIRMEHHTIIYKSKKTLILALVTSEKRLTKRKSSTVMRRIYNAFIKQYQEHLNQEIIQPQIFGNFARTIDNILQTSGVIEIDNSPKKEELVYSSF